MLKEVGPDRARARAELGEDAYDVSGEHEVGHVWFGGRDLPPGLRIGLEALSDRVSLEPALQRHVARKLAEMNGRRFYGASSWLRRTQLPSPGGARRQLSIRTHLALIYAVELARDPNDLSPVLLAELAEEFSREEVAELTFLVAHVNMLNTLETAFDSQRRARRSD